MRCGAQSVWSQHGQGTANVGTGSRGSSDSALVGAERGGDCDLAATATCAAGDGRTWSAKPTAHTSSGQQQHAHQVRLAGAFDGQHHAPPAQAQSTEGRRRRVNALDVVFTSSSSSSSWWWWWWWWCHVAVCARFFVRFFLLADESLTDDDALVESADDSAVVAPSVLCETAALLPPLRA
jgi:hypothetical protein